MSKHFEYEQEQEEEALSLCDLPINKIIRSNDDDNEKEEVNLVEGDDFEFDFDFGLLVKSGDNNNNNNNDTFETEMCSADEVFSGGQLLPFRHSVSSEGGLFKTRNVLRSESMDRIGLCSRSGSSRSSSIRSQYSSTSSTSTSSNNTSVSVKTFPIPKIKGRNNFHSHPSPKPQVWASGARGCTTNYPNSAPVSKKSTMWDVLRLGLVRGPEIELQDLKQRHRISNSSKTTPFIIPRNNSSTSTSTTATANNNNSKISDLLMELQNKKNNGGFFKSCKCSVLAIEPIPTREFVRNGRYFGTKLSNDPKYNTSSTNLYYHDLKKDKELEQKNVAVEERNKQKKNKKKVMSHQHRTFEWLRDLSHASVLNT